MSSQPLFDYYISCGRAKRACQILEKHHPDVKIQDWKRFLRVFVEPKGHVTMTNARRLLLLAQQGLVRPMDVKHTVLQCSRLGPILEFIAFFPGSYTKREVKDAVREKWRTLYRREIRVHQQLIIDMHFGQNATECLKYLLENVSLIDDAPDWENLEGQVQVLRVMQA